MSTSLETSSVATVVVYGAIITLYVATNFFRYLNQIKDEQNLKSEISTAQNELKEKPEKFKPVWEVSRIQLELYISRNQAQVRSIYWITVLVMLVGFGLISYGVVQAFNGAEIEASVIATVSGVITEFVGATLLVVYKSTISQAASYVGTLERINSVGMALQIVDQIPDDDKELKNKTRSELASKIIELKGKQG